MTRECDGYPHTPFYHQSKAFGGDFLSRLLLVLVDSCDTHQMTKAFFPCRDYFFLGGGPFEQYIYVLGEDPKRRKTNWSLPCFYQQNDLSLVIPSPIYH